MQKILVSSIDDPRLAAYRDLPGRKTNPKPDLFIAEGKLLVQRLLASQYETESIFVDQRQLASIAQSIPPGVPVYVAPSARIDETLGFNFHRGVIACGRRKPTLKLADAMPNDRRSLFVAVCVDIQDAENLGGILRNCAAFGVDTVIVSDHCCDPFSRRVLRVSMGAVLKLTLFESHHLNDDLRELRQRHGVKLVATVLDASAESLDQAQWPGRLAVLFGNETRGLDSEWIDLCDQTVTIPMQNDTDSLNVAVASGIVLHHFVERNSD